MINRMWFVLLPVLILSLCLPTAAAQEPTDSLVILMQGDLWRWSPGQQMPERLTQMGTILDVLTSPDNLWIIFQADAGIADDASAGEAIPNEIWIVGKTGSAEPELISGQPQGAAYPDGPYVIHSKPVWSPDGTSLAWTERTAGGDYQLVRHDFDADGQHRAIVPDLPTDNAPSLSDPVWSLAGIALHIYADADIPEDIFFVYGPDGALVSETRVPADVGAFEAMYWLSKREGNVIGALYADAWRTIDPISGDVQIISELPELYARDMPALSYALYFDRAGDEGFRWWFVSPSGLDSQKLLYSGDVGGVALSPSGQSVAYMGEDGVYVWGAGDVENVPGTESAVGVVWGAMQWRLSSSYSVCPEFLPPRLTVGQQGRVLPGDPNAIRSEPSRRSVTSQIIGQINSGNIFTVLDGPVCAENIVWWKIEYYDTVGWTAEGEGDSYWVEPFLGCTDDLPSRLGIGTIGRVLPGSPNVLRSIPNTLGNSEVIGEIPGEQIFEVLAGPECANTMTWWRVNYRGLEGWTPEGLNGEYWLEPALGCSDILSSRLEIGMEARVIPGESRILRVRPSDAESTIITEIPDGEVLSVLDGPECFEKMAWWEVTDGENTGWISEGDEVYWLEPWFPPATTCTENRPPRLNLGGTGRVLESALLVEMRSRPSLTSAESVVVADIPAGDTFTVIGDVRCVADMTWWEVEYADMTGWIAETNGETYFVEPWAAEPFKCRNFILSRLEPGRLARVTVAQTGILRDAPLSSGEALAEIPGGSVFAVLEGEPICAEGSAWWRVDYNGVTGWLPEGRGNVYWLEPLP